MEFDYNTGRGKLVLPEYGRNIHKMVDYIKSIEDRDKRNKLANAVVSVMGNLNPHLRDINDFKHKLWDHLAIISNFELDIDYPYDIPQAETFSQPPKTVPYGVTDLKFRHYGKTVELMIDAVLEMPESEERTELLRITANQMKKSYLMWNRETVDDEVIYNDLKKLSKGKLDASNVPLADARDLIGKSSGNNQNNNQSNRRKRQQTKRR